MNLKSLNKVFLMKVYFNIIAQPHLLWVKVLQHKYKWDLLDGVTKYSGPCSHLWRKLSGLWEDVRVGLVWQIGDDITVQLWEYNWFGGYGPLKLLAY